MTRRTSTWSPGRTPSRSSTLQGIGDSLHSYRFVAPALAEAGYRVANVDIRGCGDSSLGWDDYRRTDVAGVIELAPGTRSQPFDMSGLVRVRRYRAAYLQLGQIIVRGRLSNWKKYLYRKSPPTGAPNWPGSRPHWARRTE